MNFRVSLLAKVEYKNKDLQESIKSMSKLEVQIYFL